MMVIDSLDDDVAQLQVNEIKIPGIQSRIRIEWNESRIEQNNWKNNEQKWNKDKKNNNSKLQDQTSRGK